MEKQHPIVEAMMKGYGKEFPDLETFFAMTAGPMYLDRLMSPTPEMGRYRKNVDFLRGITSGAAYGKLRFRVMIEYFIALSEFFESKKAKNPIVPPLSREEKATLRTIGTTDNDVFLAEFIERFTDHDTAAAGDYLKLVIMRVIPRLADHIEGFHFAATSEDVIGNVTGLMLNNLVYRHFIPAVINFWESIINLDRDTLIMPGLTHIQAAEPTTLNKFLAVRLGAVNVLLKKLIISSTNKLQPFSGKMGGAIGNMTCHYASYPDLDWWRFAEEFVESRLGLQYHAMTDQCSPYVTEAFILGILVDVLEQIVKFARDFRFWVSCPGQFFVKIKKKGEKGSSIMPGKTNLWAIEGGIAMLRKTQNNLRFLASELQSYVQQGDMARSYLLRAVGGDFMPAFIGLARIAGEFNRCVPNDDNIKATLDKYPGMSGSSMQTILKVDKVEGDAYRVIQKISINPDGSYANGSEFRTGLEKISDELGLSSEMKEKLFGLFEFSNLVAPAESAARCFLENGMLELYALSGHCKRMKI